MIRVLVVDDSGTIRRYLRAVLEDANFEVIEAANGEEGLVAALRQPIELVLIDVNMPGMNGLEMLAQLRELEDYASTPVFVLTAESSPELVEQGRKVGATAWIIKPFNPSHGLISAVVVQNVQREMWVSLPENLVNTGLDVRPAISDGQADAELDHKKLTNTTSAWG